MFLFDFDNFAVAVSRVNFDFDFKVVGFEFDDPAVIAVFYVAAAVIEFSVHIVDDKIVFARHSNIDGKLLSVTNSYVLSLASSAHSAFENATDFFA